MINKKLKNIFIKNIKWFYIEYSNGYIGLYYYNEVNSSITISSKKEENEYDLSIESFREKTNKVKQYFNIMNLYFLTSIFLYRHKNLKRIKKSKLNK